ncbi:MAG: c-type cytochrome [Acidobacteriaceae bacterium]
MIPQKTFTTALIAAAIALSSTVVCAQVDQPGLQSPPPHRRPMPKPTNLKVLPKDISPEDLKAIMHQFQGQLGVHCSYCHAENKQTHHLDFASDAKLEKSAARVMIRMTRELNAKYLIQLPDQSAMEKVSCGTCHRGHSKPVAFVPPPEEHGPMPGK